MRKSNALRSNEQQDFHQCSYCGDPAEFMCSKCEQVYYCKLDHQRADWKNHSKACISYADRRKDHLEKKRKSKCQVFRLISKSEVIKAVYNIKTLIDKEKAFMQKYGSPDIQLEIELGSTICTYARLLNSSKQLSQAQDTLQDYFKDKISFLGDISNIPSKQQLQGMNNDSRQRSIYLISGKFRLISALADLMHELSRNSIDMFQILLIHFEKVYGHDSLELSNIYFYTANYFYFLKKPTKALACFLKCAKLRKSLGGTAFYNAAFLLLQSGRKKKALQFYQRALELIEKQKNMENAWVIPKIYETIGLIYMQEGMTRAMMDYFQKAYFFYVRNQEQAKAEMMLKLFMTIRKQAKQQGAQDMKTVQFPKQKKQKKPSANLSTKNYQNFKNADKQQEDERKRNMEWLTSFKELKMTIQPTILKYPKQLEYLFGNQSNKNGDEQTPSQKVKHNDNSGLGQGVFMDLGYMQTLTSIQVGYLHQLNRLLQECKERAAVYDIVENSNFYQATDQNKINHFFKMNPQLIRPTDFQRKAMIQQLKIQETQWSELQPEVVVESKKVITPKLDLRNLKNFKNI